MFRVVNAGRNFEKNSRAACRDASTAVESRSGFRYDLARQRLRKPWRAVLRRRRLMRRSRPYFFCAGVSAIQNQAERRDARPDWVNAIYTALPCPLGVPTTILLEAGSRGFKHQPVRWRVFSLWIGTTHEKRVPHRFFLF